MVRDVYVHVHVYVYKCTLHLIWIFTGNVLSKDHFKAINNACYIFGKQFTPTVLYVPTQCSIGNDVINSSIPSPTQTTRFCILMYKLQTGLQCVSTPPYPAIQCWVGNIWQRDIQGKRSILDEWGEGSFSWWDFSVRYMYVTEFCSPL